MKSLAKSLVGRISTTTVFLIIIVVSILILKEAEIVKAQNESNITGYEIADFTLENNTSSSSPNTTDLLNNISNETQITNETFIENVTNNETSEIVNVSNETFENITVNETEILNETLISNETSNETSQEINETHSTKHNFYTNLDYPRKITRGEIITAKATVTNNDSSEAKNVALDWEIPQGFGIVSGNEREFCGDLKPSDVCNSEIMLKTDVLTPVGLSEIKVVVSYEE